MARGLLDTVFRRADDEVRKSRTWRFRSDNVRPTLYTWLQMVRLTLSSGARLQWPKYEVGLTLARSKSRCFSIPIA